MRGELRRGCHILIIIMYKERDREAISYVEAEAVAKPEERKRASGRKKKEKKGERRTHFSLSTCPVCATFALKSEALGEEGDELERALMVFFPGKPTT